MENYVRNTDPSFWSDEQISCNCGSFALNVDSWFCPYDNDDHYTEEHRINLMKEMYEEGFSRESIMEAVLELDQEAILAECEWLEPILLSEAAPTDRLVAYRLFLDENSLEDDEINDDYHFRVRINGFWFEKCGEGPIQFLGTEADESPWKTTEYLIYDSDIKYFRFKN